MKKKKEILKKFDEWIKEKQGRRYHNVLDYLEDDLREDDLFLLKRLIELIKVKNEVQL